MRVIELSKSVFEELIESSLILKDVKNRAFSEYAISVPVHFYIPWESTYESFVMESKNPSEETKRLLESYAKTYSNFILTIKIQSTPEKFHVSIYSPSFESVKNESNNKRIKIFEGEIFETLGAFLPSIALNDFASEPMNFLYNLKKMDSAIMEYLEKPTLYKKVDSKVPKNKGPKKKIKGGRKSYIHKTVYVLDKTFAEAGEKRVRSITKEYWEVRGHWRTYKGGNKIWIHEYSKGVNKNATKEETIESIMKITKLD